MQKNPYLILELEQGATKEEVQEAYKRLKAKYSNLRFEEGEVGANAAKMMNKLDQAYEDCLMDIENRESTEKFGNQYGEVSSLIKEKKYDEAQDILDKCEVRDAEWHYMEAQIFYKRQWHSDAKAQLEIACDLDPENEKYKSTLNRLKKVMNRSEDSFIDDDAKENTKKNHTRAGYTNPQDFETGRAENSDACCNACSTLLCADCCCECMGGDLIPCC